MELKRSKGEEVTNAPATNHNKKFVDISTPHPIVQTPAQIADTNTFAQNANNKGTEVNGVKSTTLRHLQSQHPKYLHYNLWCDDEYSKTVAEWTIYAMPLVRPPANEINNEITTRTITNNPSLFEIVTPIKVDIFERYLKSHPNQPFVHSVCDGLRDGFWPWADTMLEGYPTMHDASIKQKGKSTEIEFL